MFRCLLSLSSSSLNCEELSFLTVPAEFFVGSFLDLLAMLYRFPAGFIKGERKMTPFLKFQVSFTIL